MTETQFLESLGLIIEAANESFEILKKLQCKNEDSPEFQTSVFIESLKADVEKHKYKSDYLLRYIVNWLVIAMLYDYTNDQKKCGKEKESSE